MLRGKIKNGFPAQISRSSASNHSSSVTTVETKDFDGETRMTGINKVRAKLVSKNELDLDRAVGVCVRYRKTNHRIARCPQIPVKRPEMDVKPTSFTEDGSTEEFLNEPDLEGFEE